MLVGIHKTVYELLTITIQVVVPVNESLQVFCGTFLLLWYLYF